MIQEVIGYVPYNMNQDFFCISSGVDKEGQFLKYAH